MRQIARLSYHRARRQNVSKSTLPSDSHRFGLRTANEDSKAVPLSWGRPKAGLQQALLRRGSFQFRHRRQSIFGGRRRHPRFVPHQAGGKRCFSHFPFHSLLCRTKKSLSRFSVRWPPAVAPRETPLATVDRNLPYPRPGI